MFFGKHLVSFSSHLAMYILGLNMPAFDLVIIGCLIGICYDEPLGFQVLCFAEVVLFHLGWFLCLMALSLALAFLYSVVHDHLIVHGLWFALLELEWGLYELMS